MTLSFTLPEVCRFRISY